MDLGYCNELQVIISRWVACQWSGLGLGYESIRMESYATGATMLLLPRISGSYDKAEEFRNRRTWH